MQEQPLNKSAGLLNLNDNFAALTAASTLTTRQRVVYGDTTDGIMTTTLPPVGDCAGLFFTFYFKTDGGDWTITDFGDETKFADIVLDNAGDTVMLYSDGLHWNTLDADT